MAEIKFYFTLTTGLGIDGCKVVVEADYYGEFAPQQYLFEQYNIKTQQND